MVIKVKSKKYRDIADGVGHSTEWVTGLKGVVKRVY